MAVLAFPMAFKRQDAFSLDVDYWFKTKAELDAYLSSALRYTGQLAYCEETDVLYILSKDKTSAGCFAAPRGGFRLSVFVVVKLFSDLRPTRRRLFRLFSRRRRNLGKFRRQRRLANIRCDFRLK